MSDADDDLDWIEEGSPDEWMVTFPPLAWTPRNPEGVEALLAWMRHEFPFYGGKSGRYFDHVDQSDVATRLLASDWLAATKADAWDEGYYRGIRDAELQHHAENPYQQEDES